jgi:hypothetical protein
MRPRLGGDLVSDDQLIGDHLGARVRRLCLVNWETRARPSQSRELSRSPPAIVIEGVAFKRSEPPIADEENTPRASRSAFEDDFRVPACKGRWHRERDIRRDVEVGVESVPGHLHFSNRCVAELFPKSGQSRMISCDELGDKTVH